MNQNLTVGWSPAERIVFRFFFTYLLLFFVFVPQLFLEEELFPFLDFLNLPYKFITTPFITWIGKNFFQITFSYNWYGGDNLFAYVTILALFVLSILITIIWSLLDKRKAYHSLYRYMHLCTRYFLAYALFSYGFNKLSGSQFRFPSPIRMLQPFGDLNHWDVLWSFMGSSRSYTFFGGLMETICGLLLLFRKTSTIGALLTLGTLTNVLMINIGYNVMVKIMLVNYLLMSFFLLAPNAKNLYKLFILHKAASFSIVPMIFQKVDKYRWIFIGLKLCLIFFMLYPLVKKEIRNISWRSEYQKMEVMYIVEEFNLRNQVSSPLTTETVGWKKIATRYSEDLAIQYANDSIKYYKYEMDTLTKTFTLYDPRDKKIKTKFLYIKPSPNHYLFEGVLNADSVHILVRKFDMDSLSLVKNRGKIKWYQ